MNRVHRDGLPATAYQQGSDRVRGPVGGRAGQDAARLAKLEHLIARALDPENPRHAEDLELVGREAALLSPAARDHLLASLPGTSAERVREALQPWLRPRVPTRPAPKDSIERAPDLGPFASGAAPSRVAPEERPAKAPAGEPGSTPAAQAFSEPPPIEAGPPAIVCAAEAEIGVTARMAAGREAQPQAIDDGSERLAELAPAALATPVVTGLAPSAGSAPAAYVGERPVQASWLAEREAALVAIRRDYEGARAQAQANPGGPGWRTAEPTVTETESGSSVSYEGLVWLADSPAAQEVVGWDEGNPVYRAVGRWVAFNEEAFAAHYRSSGGAPLQRLAALYDASGRTDAAALLAAHPELWTIATTDHAINAGPAPAGFAMADAAQLGMLDLYLDDPLMVALVEKYGGHSAPATGGIALEQVRLFGERRYEQMTRLSNAMAAVRTEYVQALDQARQRGDGPGWVERAITRPVTSGGENEQIVYGADGQPLLETVGTQRVLDPDAFTDWYIAQGGPQHQAFAAIYGRSHTVSHTWVSGESGQESTYTTTSFDNPNWTLGDNRVFAHRDLLSLDPDNPPRLRDDRLVSFDLEAGWVTPSGNRYEKRDWLETVIGAAFVAAVTYVSAGTLGAAASSAASSAATSAGYGAVASAAAGAAASAAVVGAAGAVASGMISGNLTLKSVLQGALAGALTGGVMNSEFAQAINASTAGSAGTLALRMTVQGGIQELLGGSFGEGARAAFAGGLADLAGANLKAGIDEAVAKGTMSASEAIAARTFARLVGSAIRAAGNPDDPGYAFASDFLGETVRSAGEPPFGGISEEEYRDIDGLAEQLGIPAEELVNASWREAGRPLGSAEGAGSAAGPASGAIRTLTFDDGSRLYDMGNGKFTSIPAAEYQRSFVIEKLTRRTGLADPSVRALVDGLSPNLGPNAATILAEALATGRMSVGLAGISGPGGGARSTEELAELRTSMVRATGRDLIVALDNTNGLTDAQYGVANLQQKASLDALFQFNRAAGIATDLVVHSNGVNALAASLQSNPGARLGEVRLIDVNVKDDPSRAVADLRRIVGASDRTTLVTTAADVALAWSGAGDPVRGLIPAAAAAGVSYVRVLPGTEHGLAEVLAQLDRQGPTGSLDFWRDPKTGQISPRNPDAWAEAGYTFVNGRLVYTPPAPRVPSRSRIPSAPGIPT